MEKLLVLPPKTKLTFPLPKDALPRIKTTIDETKYYRATAATIVDATVAMEREYRLDHGGLIDTQDWKLAAEKQRLRVYKRMARATESDSSAEQGKLQPMVLCVGSMPGTVDETLYALHEETTDEIRAVARIVNKSHMDAAVLDVMERGAADDPFRLLALKWRLNATPGGGMIKSRDSLTLESMGVAVDSTGERFGHVLLKSVERPDFPAFSNHVAVRSSVALCYILRQVTPDTVGIYAKGIVNLGGDVSDWFCYTYVCPRMAAILETGQALTAKRMTALAISKSRAFAPMRATTKLGSTKRMPSRSSEASGCSSEETHEDPWSCAVCERRGGARLLLRASLHSCQICDRGVCSKCLVKHELLAVADNMQALCCTKCVLEAKALAIGPNGLCPMLHR